MPKRENFHSSGEKETMLGWKLMAKGGEVNSSNVYSRGSSGSS